MIVFIANLHGSNANLASRGRSLSASDALKSSHSWINEHVVLVKSPHPERDRVGKELARSFGHTLDIWTGSEVLETRTSRDEVLSSAALAG